MSNSFSNYDTHENKSVSKEKIEYVKSEAQEVEKEIRETEDTLEIKTESPTIISSISLMEVLMIMGFGFGLMITVLNLFHEQKQEKPEEEIKIEKIHTDK